MNDPQWIHAISDARQINAASLGVGARFEQTVRGPLGRADVVWEITEFVPDQRVACKSVAGDYRFAGGYDVEPAGSGARLTKFASFYRCGMLLAVPRSAGERLIRGQFTRWLITLSELSKRW
jgi:hypothetical protein